MLELENIDGTDPRAPTHKPRQGWPIASAFELYNEGEDTIERFETKDAVCKVSFRCWPAEDVSTFENPLTSLRDVLPDVYGRREHEVRLEREEVERVERRMDLEQPRDERIAELLYSLVGRPRFDNAVEEPERPKKEGK